MGLLVVGSSTERAVLVEGSSEESADVVCYQPGGSEILVGVIYGRGEEVCLEEH